ncbi:serine hydrolase domain-containing protein [Umezawaea sp.]|uniref:serine hydrolase domain-containing protein n=1 Tax=Umezawaea sp. TaxID=1955258 RepID=UPI002ED3F7E1
MPTRTLDDSARTLVNLGFASAELRVRTPRTNRTSTAGTREQDTGTPPPADGRIRIGSNTKTFTAAVVLDLVSEGGLALDTPVADHLPRFALDRRITTRMLLQNTSGVFNHTGDLNRDGTTAPGLPSTGQEWVDNRFHTYHPDELVRLSLSKPPRFAPGTDWSYSNTNYTLAGLLVEDITGRPFADEVRRRILHPLGLRHTELPGADPDIAEPHSHGYYHYQHAGEWKTVDVTRQNTSLFFAAGDMISTTQDLSTFFSALLSGALLPAPLLAEMRTPHPKIGYGLGLFVEETDCGTTVLRHNGSTIGHGALMYSTPDGSTTLTAALTSGASEIDLATAFPRALASLVHDVFCPDQEVDHHG